MTKGRVYVCVVLTASSLLITSAANSQPNTISPRTVGQHGFMDEDWYICPSWDVFKRVQQLLKLQPVEDAQAGVVLAYRDCIKVRDQTEVVIEDTNFLWGPAAICVRPIGQPDCGWVLPGAVTTERCTPTYVSADQGMTCVPRKSADNPQRPWSFGYSGK
jgi:hypothetical protein